MNCVLTKGEIMSINEKLTCTRCNETKERYDQIVYSQGDRVCTDCKKETQASDNRAFDRDWYSSRM